MKALISAVRCRCNMSVFNFKNIKIKSKLFILIMIAALGLIIIEITSFCYFKDILLNERKTKTKQLVDVASGVVETYYTRFKAGEITEEQAKTRAIRYIKAMRYDEKEYFWINDMHPTMLMHPYNPELNGKDMTDLKDSTGKHFCVEFVKVVQKDKAGYVSYLWPRQGATKQVRKIAYVKGFEPWGWIIGSGIYLDDVETVYSNAVLHESVMAGVIFLILALVALMIIRSINKPISKIIGKMQNLANGDLTIDVKVKSNDEIGQIIGALKNMVDKLKETLLLSVDVTNKVNSSAVEIAAAIQQQAIITEQRSSSVLEISATMEEFSATSTHIADNAATVVDISDKAFEESKEGAYAVETIMGNMDEVSEDNQNIINEIVELGKRSKEINKVMEFINTIADQTKLIAFNAAIEAASAGESGKRFGVVAAEIRRLADSVMEYTEETRTKTVEIGEA
ncbi:MAG: methyl-accepting chemotaxis protein, partial [Nitrospirae bacterium]|nr:methyl-accepting chemotaxis protein [Nitrospirota bacterium]